MEEAQYYSDLFNRVGSSSSLEASEVLQLQAGASHMLASGAELVSLQGCESLFYSLSQDDKGTMRFDVVSAKACSEYLKVSYLLFLFS